MGAEPVVAAIDCGTNSTRLLVSRGGRDTVDRRMTITRLGEGVDRTGRLGADAIGRVVACLEGYRRVMDDHHVERVRMTATSAARDAANRDEFFDAAEAIVGVRPELLDGRAEGELSWRGATADLDVADGPFLVVDVGGGSTEFAVGGADFTDAISVDMGCVRMSERFLASDPPRPDELAACLSVVEAHLSDVARALPGVGDARRLVGLAGTVSTAAMIEQGLVDYDRDKVHHFVLTKEAAEDVFRTVATESAADRAHNPGLESGRVDTIVGGMCILVKIMRDLGFADLVVSEADILDGLAMSLSDR